MSQEQSISACLEPLMRRSCTLIITHQCNLNCTYCYESHKSTKKMSIDMAQRIVEKEFDFVAQSEAFSEICIDFFGGEPLIRFDMIAELSHWLWDHPRPVPYILFASSNGTLLTDKKKTWFEKHRDHFYLSLSLDGLLESHEKNRKGSFSLIDIDFFRRMWPNQPVKMTVSAETLPTLAADIIQLQQMGFVVACTLAQGVAWSEEDATRYEEQLNLLAEYYLARSDDIVPVGMLTVTFTSIIRKKETYRKFCGTGTHMITYDVDGTSYPCHMFTPLVVGDCRYEDLKEVNFLEPNNLVDQNCTDCFLLPTCPTCYGFNYKFRNNIALRDPHYCRMYKRQAKVACHFQLTSMMQKGIPTTVDEMAQAKALLHAHDLFESSVSYS